MIFERAVALRVDITQCYRVVEFDVTLIRQPMVVVGNMYDN